MYPCAKYPRHCNQYVLNIETSKKTYSWGPANSKIVDGFNRNFGILCNVGAHRYILFWIGEVSIDIDEKAGTTDYHCTKKIFLDKSKSGFGCRGYNFASYAYAHNIGISSQGHNVNSYTFNFSVKGTGVELKSEGIPSVGFPTLELGEIRSIYFTAS